MIKPTKRRYGYASSDPVQRRKKAEKIIWILEQRRPLRGLRILEIGTGSGIIAACLADRVGPEGDVTAVDVVDQRILRNGYRFIRVSDAGLRCEDQSFDVVVSNHVIEHVGTHSQQLTHLREIHRVHKPEGFGYLAAPNRWAIIEPH